MKRLLQHLAVMWNNMVETTKFAQISRSCIYRQKHMTFDRSSHRMQYRSQTFFWEGGGGAVEPLAGANQFFQFIFLIAGKIPIQNLRSRRPMFPAFLNKLFLTVTTFIHNQPFPPFLTPRSVFRDCGQSAPVSFQCRTIAYFSRPCVPYDQGYRFWFNTYQYTVHCQHY